MRLVVAALLAGTALSAQQSGERFVVTVSASGFQPSRIEATKGDAIVIEVRSAGGEHCFAIDALRVEKRVRAERPGHRRADAHESGTLSVSLLRGEWARRRSVERGELIIAR